MPYSASDPAPRGVMPPTLATRALLPLLRVQASEAAVVFLARAAAINTIAAARWAAITWGPDARFDAHHPAAAADLDTPIGRAADAIASLAGACGRHRAVTGQDGLDIAETVVARDFGAAVAAAVLGPLLSVRKADLAFASETGFDLDAAIDESGPADVPRDPDPTSSDRAAGCAAILDYLMADHRLAPVRGALEALAAASGGELDAAVVAVAAALQAAADQGLSLTELRTALDAWSDATGGPRVSVNGGADA